MKAPLHFHAWLLVATCFVSALSVTAQAADGVPPVALASSADAAIVKRVFANWTARQERTRSFHVEWNARVVRTLRRSSSVEELRRAFWVEGGDRFRLEFWRVSGKKINWDHMARGQRTWMGTAAMILEWPYDPAAAPQGAVGKDTIQEVLNDLERTALALVFRPSQLMDVQASQFRLVTEHAIVDGLHCVKLQRPQPGSALVEHCWVDPARDDVPILWEKTLRGELMWRVAIQYRLSRDHNLGWVPDRWTCQDDGAQLHVLQCTVTKLSVNESFPPKTFQLDFPPGTLVFDERSHAQFVVATNGSRAPAPQFDFVHSGPLRRALDVRPNIDFGTQPFRKAIDFVKDLKAPIEIDESAFRRAGIDPSFEVHCCDIEDLTATELLRWIAAQSPKPIALVERDGKLVLKPVTSAKETSPGSDRRTGFKSVP
jgi:hypothetical protein